MGIVSFILCMAMLLASTLSAGTTLHLQADHTVDKAISLGELSLNNKSSGFDGFDHLPPSTAPLPSISISAAEAFHFIPNLLTPRLVECAIRAPPISLRY